MANIIDPTGAFEVGIDPGTAGRAGGNIGNPISGGYRGFKRIADNWETLSYGNPREGYGVAADADAGWIDPFGPPFSGGGASGTACGGTSSGLLNESAFIFGTSTASGVVVLAGIMRLEKTYTFVAPNILRIVHKITNISATNRTLKFRRIMDWDCDGVPAPSTRFNEDSAFFPALVSFTAAHSRSPFGGTECANPLVPYFHPVPAGGASYPPTSPGMSDQGIAVDVNLGLVGAGDFRIVNVYYGISQTGQNEAALRAQLTALGVPYVASMNWLDPTDYFGSHTTDRACVYGISVGCCPCASASGCCCEACGDGRGTIAAFTVAASGFTGDCATFNGTRTLTCEQSGPFGFACYWTYEDVNVRVEIYYAIPPTVLTPGFYLHFRDHATGSDATYLREIDPWARCDQPFTFLLHPALTDCLSAPPSFNAIPVPPPPAVPTVCAYCCGERTWPATMYCTITNLSGAACLNGLVVAMVSEGDPTNPTAYVSAVFGTDLCRAGTYWYINIRCHHDGGHIFTAQLTCAVSGSPFLEICSFGDSSAAGPTIQVCDPFHVRIDIVLHDFLPTCTGGACLPDGTQVRLDFTW